MRGRGSSLDPALGADRLSAAPVSRLLLFLLVVLSIVGGVHFYLWVRLIRDTQLPLPLRTWVTAALIALAVSLPATFLLMRRLPLELARLVAWPGFVWMGLMFLSFTLVLAGDIVRLLVVVGSKVASGGLDPGRRLLLARLLGGGAAVGAGVVGAVALRRALARVEVKEVGVRLTRLSPAHHGTTIVQLTDLHVGPTIGRAFIEDIVRRTNELRPDLVAITGDLVDGPVERLRHAVEPLRDLRARHGVFFVTGNHEYFSGAGPWIAELGRLGIRVLRNERVSVGGDGGFDVAGIDDHSAGRLGEAPSDLDRAMAGRDPARAVVLLAHQPRAIFEAARLGVDLQLSGHTHGGQIWPFTYLVKLQQPYIAGLHRHGDTQIYVSPGTGYWGPPMRLGTRAEITRVTLHAG
jgi:predicted MPP superfamily phosphohydrolase